MSDSVQPSIYEITYINNMATVRLRENITEEAIIDENNIEQTDYKYDEYTLKLRKRDNLEKDISTNFDKWLELAKTENYNNLASDVRTKRDKLLLDTDKYMLEDYPIEEEEKEKYITYRQKLRDITEQENFPYTVEFPSVN